MAAVSPRHGPATHGPAVSSIAEADKLQAVQAAITALAQGKSWALALTVLDIGLNGEASISDISRRTGSPVSTISDAVKIASTGHYERNAGRVVKPRLPGVLAVRKGPTDNVSIVALAPAGLALLNALSGNWQPSD